MKKILLSLLTVSAVAAVAFYGTRAFFSDVETSTGNTFQAGAIDLKVDSTAHYNGMVCVDGKWEYENPDAPTLPDYPVLGTGCTGTWELTDLTQSKTFFDYDDLKPGDLGENTISLHVYDNDAYVCATINPTLNDDVSSNEPELESGDALDTDSIFDGELAQNMQFRIWADMCTGENTNYPSAYAGDNIYQAGCDGEPLLTSGSGILDPVSWALADSTSSIFGSGPMEGEKDYYIGMEWSLPASVGNQVQTDKYMADISFYAVQSRNNPTFKCPAVAGQVENGVLRLENEPENTDGPWTVLSSDDVWVDMTYNTSGETFNYSLVGKGLAASTSYDLIYYADGWPGNNPGAFIGTHTTDGSGDLNVTTISKELGMDLPSSPDGNFAKGAKIWLVLASDYDETNHMMTAWNPDQYLFEGNVYIHYNDTGVNP